MTEPQFIGSRIDALGITASLPEDILVSDALVILECVWPDGHVSLYQGHVPGTSWIKRVGMLTVAQRIENSGFSEEDD